MVYKVSVASPELTVATILTFDFRFSGFSVNRNKLVNVNHGNDIPKGCSQDVKVFSSRKENLPNYCVVTPCKR